MKYKPKLSSIEARNITSMSYNASLNGQEVVANLDPGASHAFISTKAALSCGLSIFNSDQDEVELGDHSTTAVHGMVSGILKIDGYSTPVTVYLLSMPDNVDGKPFIVFGRKWLQVDNPYVDWNTNAVHITRSGGSKWVIKPRNYTKPISSVSIKSISLKKMSALVKKKKAELFAVRLRPAISTMNIADGFQDLIEELKDVFLDELPTSYPLIVIWTFLLIQSQISHYRFVQLFGYLPLSSKSFINNYSYCWIKRLLFHQAHRMVHRYSS